eukprot:751511-Hanusia_phi.AAC.8
MRQNIEIGYLAMMEKESLAAPESFTQTLLQPCQRRDRSASCETITPPQIAIFSFAHYDGQCLVPALSAHVGTENLKCLPVRLSEETVELANGCEVVCLFVNDIADERVVNALADLGVKSILLRSTGFNHVDLECAAKRGLDIRRVPVYSPYAVAEMAVGLLLSLVRESEEEGF